MGARNVLVLDRDVSAEQSRMVVLKRKLPEERNVLMGALRQST